MKLKNIRIATLAVVLAVAASAFTTAKTTTPNQLSGSKYWYEVDPASQTILQNTPLYQHAVKSAVNTDCPDDPNAQDCLRGFDTPQNTSMGDISDPGSEQIRLSENP